MRARLQDGACKNRQQRRIGHREETEHGHDRQQRPDMRRVPGIPKTFGEEAGGATLGSPVGLLDPHGEQAPDHDEEAESIQQKAHAFADRHDQHSGDGWADDTGRVEGGGVQANGGWNDASRHKVGDEGMARRNVHRVHDADEGGKPQHPFDGDLAGEREDGECRGLEERQGLRWRGQRSASRPPSNPKSRIGAQDMNSVSPSRNGEPVKR